MACLCVAMGRIASLCVSAFEQSEGVFCTISTAILG
jgi:hypothetical protein